MGLPPPSPIHSDVVGCGRWLEAAVGFAALGGCCGEAGVSSLCTSASHIYIFCDHVLSGPISRDTAILSLRYPISRDTF